MNRSIAPGFVIPDEFVIQEAKKVTLSNGIQCHYINSGDQSLIKLEFHFLAGNQSDGGTFASLFTAKLFPEGTKTRSSQAIAEAIAFHGAYLDISSGNEKLIVDVYVLVKHLDKILDVVLDVISDPVFGDTEFNRICEAQKQGLAVSNEKTSFLASQEFKKQLFPNHYYSSSLTAKHIDDLTTDKLKQFYSNQLKGQKFELFISGSVTEDVLSLVDSKISQLNFISGNKEFKHDLSNHVAGNYKVEKEGSLQASVRFGFQTIRKTHSDFCKLSFVNEILGGYFGSRLMSNIREEKGYTYGVGSYLTQLKHGSFFQILTDVKAEHAVSTVEEIQKEIKILQTQKVSLEEIDKVKNYLVGSFASSINTPFDLMDKYKSVHFFGLDYSYFNSYIEEVRSISAEDIIDTANQYLSTDPVIVVCG